MVSSSANQDSSEFKGTVLHISFQNKENGFTVLRAQKNNAAKDQTASLQNLDDTIVTVVGLMPPDVTSGVSFVAQGEWQKHPTFGRQFRVKSFATTLPTGKEAIINFLASGALKGCGEVMAQRIVEAFGEETFDIFDNSPEKLLKVSGIGEKKYEELLVSWNERKNLKELFLFFQNYEISLSLAQRIYSEYGSSAVSTIKSDPYSLARDVVGIGFQTADRIALSLGFKVDSPQRVLAGVAHTLLLASEDGNCFIPLEELILRTQKLLNLEDAQLVRTAVDSAVTKKHVVLEDGNLFLPALCAAERYLTSTIANRIEQQKQNLKIIPLGIVEKWSEQVSYLSSNIQEAEAKVIKLSDEQAMALELAAKNTITVITGGPGCGKTTVLRQIVSMFREAGLTIKLCAPTGRAAQRMQEVCNQDASTIHRLLKFDPMKRVFEFNEENQLEADVVVVDESSMLDVLLAEALFKAIPQRTRIVVVGDADQLPSVGPGLFLSDLLSVSQIMRINLTKLFRRDERSMINEIAFEINKGNVPEIPEPDGHTKSEAYFISRPNAISARETVEKLVVDIIPKKFGFSSKEITVLTPMNLGELGIVSINRSLQNRLIPKKEGDSSVKVGELEFRLGDRVCQRSNNYNITEGGVFNGDQGEIIGIDAENKSLIVRLWDRREILYSKANIAQLDLSYALTIHRSQGSEMPVVVLALHDSHYVLLERQLLYTAVTRAKKLLVVVGSKRALSLAVKHTHGRSRNTMLALRLQKRFGRRARNVNQFDVEFSNE